MLFKRNAAPNNRPSVDEIVIHNFAALEGMDGGIPPGDMVKGRYVITRHQAALSRKVLSVGPGDVFVFETDVRLERTALAAEKNASPFFVGPIFYDANGEVLQWLQPRPAPADAERIVIRAKAPENAASARLGVCGPWEPDGTATDYVISFGPTQLKQDYSMNEAASRAEDHDARIAAEIEFFRNMDLNALPEIYSLLVEQAFDRASGRSVRRGRYLRHLRAGASGFYRGDWTILLSSASAPETARSRLRPLRG